MELKRFMDYYEGENIYFNIWAVEEKLGNQFIGLCGVYKNEHAEYEIAFRLREQFWGNGFGREMAKGLIGYCFKNENINEISAYAREGNIGSINILEREMIFEKEIYSEKGGCMERVYKLKKTAPE